MGTDFARGCFEASLLVLLYELFVRCCLTDEVALADGRSACELSYRLNEPMTRYTQPALPSL